MSEKFYYADKLNLFSQYFELSINITDNLLLEEKYYTDIRISTNYNTIELNYEYQVIQVDHDNDVFEILYIDKPNLNDTFDINETIYINGHMNTISNDLDYELVINQLFVRNKEVSVDDHVIIESNRFYYNPHLPMYEFRSDFRLYDNDIFDDFTIFGNIAINGTIVFDYWDGNGYFEVPIWIEFEINNKTNENDVFEILNIEKPNLNDTFDITNTIHVIGLMNTISNDLDYELVINQLFVRNQEMTPYDYIVIESNSFNYDSNVTLYEFKSAFRIYDYDIYDNFPILGDIEIKATLVFDYWDGNGYFEIPISIGFEIINNGNNNNTNEYEYPSIEITYTEEVIEPNGFFYIEGKISDPRPYWVDFNIDSVVLLPDYISMLNNIDVHHWNYSDVSGIFLLNFVIEEPQNLDLNEYMMNISLTLYYDGYELLVPIDFLSLFQYGLGNQNEEIKFEIISYSQLLSNDDIFELQAYLQGENGYALLNSEIQFRIFYWLNNQQFEVTLDYDIQFSYNDYDNGTMGDGYFELKIYPEENINLREGDYQLVISISLENSKEDIEFLVDFTRTLDEVVSTEIIETSNSTSSNNVPQVSLPVGLPGFELFYIFSMFALIPILKKKNH